MVIRKVGIRSLANILGSIYVAIGFIAGVFMSLVALLGSGPGGGSAPLAALFFSPLAIVVLPILYGVTGYIAGALAGWVFNRAAGALGGLELEVDLDRELARSQAEP